MRNIFIIILLMVTFAAGIGIFNSFLSRGEVKPGTFAASHSIAPKAQVVNTPEPIPVLNPAIFSIPSIGVENVPVESVGLDKENKMDIPKDEDNVAWYNLGAKPGELGSAVIAGHFDKTTGAPSVFYDINKLKPGDELIVKDKDGKTLTYAVTEVKSYELADFPLQEVFDSRDKARLNLITCEGNFNASSRLYSHRLVVFSELKI